MLHSHRQHRWALAPSLLLALALSVAFTRSTNAHETDQYTMPVGREFADLGPYLTKYFYNIIEKGVEKQNKRIRQTASFGGKEARDARTPDDLVSTVNAQFPIALALIDEFDRLSTGKSMALANPGKVVGYKNPTELRKNVDFSLNPFK